VGLVTISYMAPWLWMKVSFAATILQLVLAVFLAAQRMIRSPEGQNALSAPSDKPGGISLR
jgi:hypothetical protein